MMNDVECKQRICDCTGTTEQKITQLLKQGKNSLEEIVSATGATTGCGACDTDIIELIKCEKQKITICSD